MKRRVNEVEEALADAVTVDVDGTPARVFTAEHLAAVALQTGRAKDKARPAPVRRGWHAEG